MVALTFYHLAENQNSKNNKKYYSSMTLKWLQPVYMFKIKYFNPIKVTVNLGKFM